MHRAVCYRIVATLESHQLVTRGGDGRIRLASGIALWFYKATQSRIHVIVTHAFLRSLARLDLAESRVLRFPPQRVGGPDAEREADRASRFTTRSARR